MATLSFPPSNRDGFKVAIICALPLEAEYVQSVFDTCWDEEGKQYGKANGDKNAYTTGLIGRHDVVLVHMPNMGSTSASAVAANIVSSFPSIQLGLVVGICGAVPLSTVGEEIILGDVIISTAVMQYDFGRQYHDEFDRKKEIEDSLGRASREIRAVISKLRTRPNRRRLGYQLKQTLERLEGQIEEVHYPGTTRDRLYEADYPHQHQVGRNFCDKCQNEVGSCSRSCNDLGCDKNKLVFRKRLHSSKRAESGTELVLDPLPTVHFGRMGSANAVMKSSTHRDKIAKEDGVTAFEMEGAGVWDELPTIVIKGVCDYADSHKNKEWQEYAAATAAACMKAFLSEWIAPNQVLEKGDSLVPIFHVPFDRGQVFVGRIDELQTLKDKLFNSGGLRTASVLGLGGVGKSRLAIEMVYQTRLEKPEVSIFWIQAVGQLTLEKDMLEIGKKLRIPGIEDSKADIKSLVKLRLSDLSSGRWLLILDNADDELIWARSLDVSDDKPKLTDYLPRAANGSILITTRSRRVANDLAGKEVVNLQAMPVDDAVNMFERQLEKPELAVDRNVTTAVMEKLTYLPLAITQSASFINMTQRPVQTYLQLLDEPEEEVIKLLSENFEDPTRYPNAINPVALTWLISFDHISQNHSGAADFLSFMACLHEKNIPRSLLPEVGSELETLKAIAVLEGYSFVARQTIVNGSRGSDELYNMHRLVQLATRNWLKMKDKLVDCVIASLRRAQLLFPTDHYENKSIWTLYAPHAQRLCEGNMAEDLPERYNLLEKMGLCFIVDGKYSDAVELHSAVVAWRENRAGVTEEQILEGYNKLGRALDWQGDRSGAEFYLQQAFDRRRELLGQENPATLDSQAKLATTYLGQGRWKEAEELLIQVLTTEFQRYGEENADILADQDNLALCYGHQGLWKEAEDLQKQNLRLRQQISGTEHPYTLTSQNNLASTYLNQGRFEDAEELYKQILRARQRVLGHEHPETLISQSNLAPAI
ncbi:MAG: hypothetical protein Q9160_001012 [Pyrenula sp. 1 TL-2023]